MKVLPKQTMVRVVLVNRPAPPKPPPQSNILPDARLLKETDTLEDK